MILIKYVLNKVKINDNSRDFDTKINKIFQNALDNLVKELKKEFKSNKSEIIDELKEGSSLENIPIAIFKNDELSALETIIKYLKENYNLRYSKIAYLLNRDPRGIWISYNNAIKKKKERFIVKDAKYIIPISIFKENKYGALELISEYLHDNYNLSYHEIAILLNRDDRTIWTSYHNIKKKRILKGGKNAKKQK